LLPPFLFSGSSLKRRSILVRSAVYQEGPKNPLKGISLKPLVLASNAQFGVGAGGKYTRFVYLHSQGDHQWHGEPDPVYVETCSCAGLFGHIDFVLRYVT
jgi:hypothetical protein